MPKPQKVRDTTNPLGIKINEVMAEKQMAGDYAQLAKTFGVATTSTYDWISHGRLGKDRYSKLVEWSGRSLDWWFDIDSSSDKSRPSKSTTAPVPLGRGEKWPFSTPLDRVRRLGPVDLALIDGYIKGVTDTREIDARKSS